MRDLISIGRFANLTDLSPKLLRKLDERGLLSPVYVDPETRYRYYDHTQIRRASLIHVCRQLGLPNGEIRELLLADDPDTLRRHLERQRARVTRRLADDAHTLDLLEQELSRGKRPLAYEVALKDAPAQLVVSCRGRVTRTHPHDAYLVERGIEVAGGRAADWLAKHAAEPVGAAIVLYHGDLVEVDEMVFDVCLPVADPVPEGDEVRCWELPAVRLAFTTHQGSYDTIWGAHAEVYAWAAEHGHKIAGPGREIGHVSSQHTSDPHRWVTEVSLPVVTGE
jgi:DNA-binding transcriptional MerR regulator